MALIANSSLPALATMADEGVLVSETGTGLSSLSVGLLNLMPDAALRATDRQFVRLACSAAAELDIRIHPFTVAGEHRGLEARRHVSRHYETFASIVDHGLDALIITGANPAQHDLQREAFWAELGEVLDWATGSTKSVLCSCLATHAVLQRYRNKRRTRLPRKRWGVYSHTVWSEHPLLDGLSTTVDAPHSHWYDVTVDEMEALDLVVTLVSEEAGAHMAVSEDDFYVFFQGHPEYDEVSLLKEYKREVGRYFSGERDEYPPFPAHYFDEAAETKLSLYRSTVEAARASRAEPPPFPDEADLRRHENTWTRAGKVIYRNWLRRVIVS